MACLAQLTPPRDPGRIDLLGTAYELPAANDSFDAVLCTTVLEHLEEPAQVLAGFWVTFGQALVYYLTRLNGVPLIRQLPVVAALGLVVQAVAGILDRLDRADECTWAYLVVARAAT
jgi:hypothetical protein